MRSLVLTGAAAALVACGPGANTGDCDDTLLPGDLVITEVFADSKAPPGGSGTDEGKEWFEVYNAADRPVELKGLTITHSRPDGSRAKSHVMADITIAPGQYLTLGNSASDLLSPYVDYGYSADLGDFFNTDGGKLALACGSSEIDAAGYDSIKEGRSRQLTATMPPDYTLNDDGAMWCESSGAEFEAGNFGTPGAESDCTPVIVGQCNDNGTMRDSVFPVVGDLVITEVMPNPEGVSDTAGEWFEILALNGFDLNGVSLDRAGDTTAAREISSPDCLHVDAGDYAVFAKNADMTMNGGLPAGSVFGTFTFSLVDGTVAAPGDVRILVGADVLDSITWTSTRSGRSHALDPDYNTPLANDDESNFCDGSTAFGAGDQGTPFAANAQCATVAQPGQCLDNGTPRNIEKPAAGTLLITEVMVNPKIESPAGHEWFEIKNVGSVPFDINGLGLERTTDTRQPDVVAVSDCKRVLPGGYAVFTHTANSAQLDTDGTFGFSMANTLGDPPHAIQVLDGTTVLDSFTYGNVSAAMYDGFSLALDADVTAPTPDPAVIDAPPLAPGTLAEPRRWCLGSTPYGDNTNQGTPKAANGQCPDPS